MSALPRAFIFLAFAAALIIGRPVQAQESANSEPMPHCTGLSWGVLIFVGNMYDSYKGDSDYDGLDDAWEMRWFKNLNETATGDPDDDGVNNGTEGNGTYPVQVADSGEDSRDSDGDGLWDGEEVELGTDGTYSDTDDDGFSDYEEVNGTCGYVTDPKEKDTDSEGLTDWQEVEGRYYHLQELFQTDPTNPDTDFDGLTDYNEIYGDVDPSDTDFDGLNDEWERYWFGDLSTLPIFDLDYDGCNNECEEAHGTQPIQVPGGPVVDSRDTDGDGLTDGDEVFVYNTDGTDTDTDDDGLSDYDEVFVFVTDPNEPDTDGDGLDDGQEIAGIYGHLNVVYQTDPLNPDTDADTISDYDEIYTHLTNPLLTDTDMDTLLDGDEINIHNTNPNVVDTDADSLTDPYEVNTVHAGGHETLANNPDTDGDGLGDGAELNTYETKPWAFDSDGDGLSDYDEVILLATNPNAADTDADQLTDRDEVQLYLTNPLLADTDGDTVMDGDEILLCGTSPTDASTFPPMLDADYCEGGGSTDPDTDDDMLPDVWEVTTFGHLGFGPLDDPDGDGLTNGDERIFGTHGNMVDTDGDGRSDGEEIFGIGGPASNPKNPDTDFDGLIDGDEVNVYGTNPTLADTDADTLSDPDEIYTHGTNPVKSDTDDDGLTDAAEIQTHLTNPVLADTDTDGLSDGAEVSVHLTNPLLADTDADGLNDGQEILLQTDPHDTDTDADGLSDGQEIQLQTDPLKPDTDADGVDDGDEIICGTLPTASSTFPPYPDADYCAGTASVELIANGGFEDGVLPDKSPVGWTVKNALGDKVKCDPLKAYSGHCAFKFRGGAAENTHLTQGIDLTGVTFRQGDSLFLTAFFKGANKAVKAKFILTVVYADGSQPVKKIAKIGPGKGYAQVSLPVVGLDSASIQAISVKVKHKSLAGALWLDAVSLMLSPASGAGTRSLGAPPSPAAPEAFRGSN